MCHVIKEINDTQKYELKRKRKKKELIMKDYTLSYNEKSFVI